MLSCILHLGPTLPATQPRMTKGRYRQDLLVAYKAMIYLTSVKDEEVLHYKLYYASRQKNVLLQLLLLKLVTVPY